MQNSGKIPIFTTFKLNWDLIGPNYFSLRCKLSKMEIFSDFYLADRKKSRWKRSRCSRIFERALYTLADVWGIPCSPVVVVLQCENEAKHHKRTFVAEKTRAWTTPGDNQPLLTLLHLILYFSNECIAFFYKSKGLKVYFSPLVVASFFKQPIFIPHNWVHLSNTVHGIQINLHMSDPVIWQLILVLHCQQT